MKSDLNMETSCTIGALFAAAPMRQTSFQRYVEKLFFINFYDICSDISLPWIKNLSSLFWYQTAQPDPIELQRQQAAKRRQMAKKQAKLAMRVRSPDAVEGRKHVEVQSELYLEELSDRVEEADIECQTDAFLDRPPSPLFVPAKSGVDIATQILEGEVHAYRQYTNRTFNLNVV